MRRFVWLAGAIVFFFVFVVVLYFLFFSGSSVNDGKFFRLLDNVAGETVESCLSKVFSESSSLDFRISLKSRTFTPRENKQKAVKCLELIPEGKVIICLFSCMMLPVRG